MNNIRFVEYTKVWVAISLILILIGFGFIAFKGLNLGVDFAGGSVIYANIGEDYSVEDVRTIVSEQDIDAVVISAGERGQDVMIRIKYLENQEEIHQDLVNALQEKYNLTSADTSIDYVGPTMGKELIRNAITSMLIACALILVYIWIRFELKSGVAAVVALLHDVLVMIAVAAIFGIQINSSFVAAILTIVGYSINDTIVVFDRVRENNKRLGRKMSKGDIVNQSINESITRSLNTSLTTLFTITTLYVFGVESIKEFTLPILVGVIAGTYSSVFIASPIWAVWNEWLDSRKTMAVK